MPDLNGRLHFVAGLPRAGSTLLAAILRQNPRFHAGMTSPLGTLYLALEGAMSRRNEGAVFLDEARRAAVLRGLFESYYGDVGGERVVFDTNRAWCAKLPALARLFPAARVICCVRSVNWIMDSVERLVRRNAFEPSGLFGFEPGGTVYSRVNRLAASDGIVGFALDALREAFHGEEAGRLVLVEYHALAADPEATMRRLYALLGASWFDHDFDNVAYDARDFDLQLGTPGLHTVRRKVDLAPRASVLPPDLFQRFRNDAFWRDPATNRHGVPVIGLEGLTGADAPV